eukprot:gene23969-31115_t
MLSLSPLKCTGKVSVKSNNMADRSTSSSSPLSSSSSPPASYDTVFLCKSGRLEFIDDNKANPTGDVVTICDVVPLVLDYNPLLKEGTYSFRSLLVRDKGVFDNLPYDWYSDRVKKKQLFDTVQELSRIGKQSPFNEIVNFRNAVESQMQLKITSLVLEEKDIYASGGISLGGAVVLANTAVEEASKWIPSQASSTSTVIQLPTAADEETRTAYAANCHLDELLGFSQALQLPIFCSSSLFRKISMDAELRRDEKAASLCIYGEVGATTPSIGVVGTVLAWEIFDANQFFTLSSREKRAILRASGVADLPRPRLGPAVLDEILLDLMDDAVRQEVRRKQKQMDTGIEETAIEDSGDGDGAYSSRATVLQAMGKALEDGDMDSAI